MKNQKFLSLAFVIALLCTFVPQTLAGTTDVVNVQATVGEALNIDVDDATISPSVVPGATTSPDDSSTVTIDSNDPQGVDITIAAADVGSAADVLCIESGTPGTCTADPKFATDGVDDGTATYLKVTTTAGTTSNKTEVSGVKIDGSTNIYQSTDALIEDDTFTIQYNFFADYGLKAGLYEGNLTFTIAGKA